MTERYSDDIEDLLGGTEEPAMTAVGGRASSRTSDRTMANLDAALRKQKMDTGRLADDILDGVSAPFLGRVFDLDPVTVRKRLVGCPRKGVRTSGALYDLATAAAYLVKPKMDPLDFLKRMKQHDLPPQLQDAYWSAILKRQKVEENAGDLWRSADVLDIMSEVLKAVREAAQLFPSTLERESSLSDEQSERLTKLLDELQADIHRRILDFAAMRRTRSAQQEVEELGKMT